MYIFCFHIWLAIGSWGDTKSTIRQGYQHDFPDFWPKYTNDLLDPAVFREFNISWAEGHILVYKAGSSSPILSYTHSNPFPVNFIGFTTGFGSTGVFAFCGLGKLCCVVDSFFNCLAPDSNNCRRNCCYM